MKKLIILLLFVSSIISAQQKDFEYSLSGISKVVISSETHLNITAGSTAQLVIKSEKSNHGINENHEDHSPNNKSDKTDKRKGLTAIYAGGKDNTNGFGFSITKEKDILYVTDLKSMYKRNGLNINLPKNMNISVDSGNMGSINMDGFTGEVEASANVGSVVMKNVTGPLTIDANVGKVDIDFDTVSQKSPITISTSVSEIDVAIPKDTKANLELNTQGSVYTNFNFDTPKKKGMPNVSGRKSIISKLNEGGVKFYIKSSMGNIYLRKKE